MLPMGIIRADVERGAHLDEKSRRAALNELVWVEHDPEHFVATVPGGAYVLRKVDSRSRVRSQRYRWKALWAPVDSPDVKELALEKRKEWSRGAAEAHYKRSQR